MPNDYDDSNVAFISKPKLNYDNMFEFISESEYWDKNTLFICVAGGNSIIETIKDEECIGAKCEKPLLLHVLKGHLNTNGTAKNVDNLVTRVKDSICNLHRAVLLNSSNDDILFSTIIPVCTDLMNQHNSIIHKEKYGHDSTNLLLTDTKTDFNDVLKVCKTINSWIDTHSRSMSYLNWNLEEGFFKTFKTHGGEKKAFNKSKLSGDGFSLKGAAKEERKQTIIDKCKETLDLLDSKKVCCISLIFYILR